MGLSGLYADGIVGLMARKPKGRDSQLFVDEAYAQGQIAHRVFSFSIRSMLWPSYMTIGGYNMDKFARSAMTWHKINDGPFWEIPFQGMMIGDEKIVTEADQMVVDTGTSLIAMPISALKKFATGLKKSGFNCEYEGFYDSFITCKAHFRDISDFPNLEITLGEGDSAANYIIPYDHYLSYDAFAEAYLVGVMSTGENGMYMLGLNFFQNYYSVFDMENERIGFAQSKEGKHAPQSVTLGEGKMM